MFQLEKPTAIECISVTARPEFHGDEKVSAISWRFRLKGENTLLDLIQPGLRKHHYHSAAADARQDQLPELGDMPLPNLRFPKLPTRFVYGGNDFKSRGYRWVWDWGTQDAHVDFTDVVLSRLTYDLHEGGSVEIEFSVAYNGDELVDDALYGELCKLSAKGEIYIQLFAPPELMAVKKGYRAGRADVNTKSKDPAQGELQEEGDGGEVLGEPGAFVPGDDDGDVLTPGSPEAALAGAEKLH